MLKKIFNYFGYTFSKSKKSTNIYEIIKLRLDSCPTDILLDVGANHGDFSKNLINYFKQLHLFEPNDELSKFLYKNFKQNKVKILNFGLGDTNEKIFSSIIFKVSKY
jgi:hypothetical protein